MEKKVQSRLLVNNWLRSVWLIRLWNENWHQHLWVIVFVLLVFLIIVWGVWASSYGTTNAGRDIEIRALIASTHDWENANEKLNRIKQIVMANPASVLDAENAIIQAENEVETARKQFDAAGFKALYGELIIISGILLQVIVAFVLTKAISTSCQRIRKRNILDSDKLRKDWIKKIRAGQVLEEEDEILKIIDDEAVNLDLSTPEILRGQKVTIAYKRLMAKCRKAKREEISWLPVSSLLYKLALICKQRKGRKGKDAVVWGEWESSIRAQYQELRQIIRQDIKDAAYSAIIVPAVFLAVFTTLNFDWNSLSGEVLGQQLYFWRDPVLWVGAAFVANGIVHVWGAFFAHWLAEKTWTDLDDVIVSAIIGPLSALVTAIFLLLALNILTGPANSPLEFGPFLTWIAYEATADISRTLVVVFVGTWFAVFILNHVLVWFMEQWAKRTTQIYDDMFVRMVQVFGTFILLAIGGGAALAVFNGPLSEATGVDNIILPYTIIVSVFTAIAGYAASAGFENFFGGLLLQIEKPFDRGERIILPDGQICDVRDVGMRSTVLYNVTEHSEVSVPNSEMAKMIINNSSRPDLELRIAIPTWISPGVRNLKIAGAILLNIAYLEKEIDQMRVFKAELSSGERNKLKENFVSSNRITIEEGMNRLVRRHVKIRKTIVSQIIGGGGESEPEFVFAIDEDTKKDPWRKVLNNIAESRRNYRESIKEENDWLLEHVREIEGDKADEMLRNYRRAINEVVFLDYSSSQDELSAMVREV